MIIKNLYLRSLGKFKNQSFDFYDGLNIVYGENEAGKSTLSNAIKTCLYRDINAKKKYKKNLIPIGETKGSFDLTFENGDRTYKSLVTLGLTNGKTLVKTYKEPEGELVDTGDNELGEYIFNMDEKMFDSVCHLRDINGFKSISDNKDSVSEELSKTNSKTVIDVDLTETLSEIDKEIKEYVRPTKSGRIFPLTERLSEINNDILNIKRITDLVKEDERRVKDLDIKIKDLEKELVSLKEKEEYILKYEDWQNTKKQLEIRNRIKETEAIISGEIKKPEIPEKDLEIIKNFRPEKVGNNSLLLIMAIATLVLSIALSFINPVLLTSVIIPVLCLILYLNGQKKKAQIKKEEEAYNNLLSLYKIKDYDYYTNMLIEYEKKASEKEHLKEKISEFKNELKEYNREYEGIFLDPPKYSKEAIAGKKEEIKNSLNLCKIEKIKISEQSKNAFNNLPDYEELSREKEELEKNISKLSDELSVARDCYEILGETVKSFKASYLPYLRGKTEEILNKILPSRVDFISLSEDFSLKVRMCGENEEKEDSNLSSGMSDLLNFALRLAIYSLVCDNNSIPLILDDCFIELDDKRFEKVMEYLIKNFNNQIIYFTAHKRIFNFTLENSRVVEI